MENSSTLEDKKKPVILCIDDEFIILKSLSYLLKKEFGKEYDIESFNDSESALNFIKDCNLNQIEIPLIFCDQVMPVMRGDEFLEIVHRIIPNTRKIMLTGLASAESIGNALNKANLYRYIAKPWQNNDIILTTKEALRSFYADKTLEEKNKELEKSFFYQFSQLGKVTTTF